MAIEEKDRFELTSREEIPGILDLIDKKMLEFPKDMYGLIPRETIYPNRRTIITITQVIYDVYKYDPIFVLAINDISQKKMSYKIIVGRSDLIFFINAEIAKDRILSKRKPRKPKGLRASTKE